MQVRTGLRVLSRPPGFSNSRRPLPSPELKGKRKKELSLESVKAHNRGWNTGGPAQQELIGRKGTNRAQAGREQRCGRGEEWSDLSLHLLLGAKPNLKPEGK